MTRPDNTAQKAAASFRIAARDQDFLLGDSMRGVRFLLEYAKAEERLRAWGVRSTIVVFGSARTSLKGENPRWAHWYEQVRLNGTPATEKGGALYPMNGQ